MQLKKHYFSLQNNSQSNCQIYRLISTEHGLVHVPILGGCQGRRTGVGVTTVSNSLILEGG